MENVTKRMESTTNDTVGVRITVGSESEALCSVEVGETAPEGKGQVYAKSCKAYGFTVEDAGRTAMAELTRLRREMGR